MCVRARVCGGLHVCCQSPAPLYRSEGRLPPYGGGTIAGGCMGGGSGRRLARWRARSLSFGSLHLVCVCVHVRMASLSRIVRGRERYLPRTLGVPVTLGGGEEGSVSDRAALHAWRGRGECASTCIVCCAGRRRGGQAWAVVGRAGRTCVVRALSWCIVALRAGCVARGLTGRRCMMCRVGSRWGRVAAGRARRGRIRARV